MDNLERSLLRWVQEGLITPEQAQRIRDSDRAQLPEDDDFGIAIEPGPAAHPAAATVLDPVTAVQGPPAPAAPERSLVALEATAYFGTMLVLVALAVIIGRSWDELRTFAHVLILLVAAVITFVAGLGLGKLALAPYRRLGSVMWGLSILFLDATVIDVLAEEVIDVPDRWMPLIVSTVSLIAAGAMWLRRKSELLQLLAFLSTQAFATSFLALPEHAPATLWFGAVITTVGLVWLFLNWAGVIKPERPAWIFGAASTLIGVQIATVTYNELGAATGLVAAILLITAGVVMSKNTLLAIGSVGAFVFLYQCVQIWFGNSQAVNITMLVIGIIIVATVLVRLQLTAHRRSVG